MPIRHLTLTEPQYVPSYNTLDLSLVNTVDSQIQHQGEMTNQARTLLDEFGQTMDQQLIGLPQADRQKFRESLIKKQQEIDNLVETRGARHSLHSVQRLAREYQNEVTPGIQYSQRISEIQNKISESDADPELKAIARYRLSDQMGDSIFNEQGEVKRISMDNVVDILSGYKNIQKEALDYVSSLSEQEIQTLMRDVGEGFVGTLTEKGILKDTASSYATTYALQDPQMRAQLMLKLEHLAFAKDSNGNYNRPEWLKNFEDDEGNLDLHASSELEISSLDNPEVKYKVNLNPLQYLTMIEVAPAARSVTMNRTIGNVRKGTGAINQSAYGFDAHNVLTGSIQQVAISSKEEGLRNIRDYYNRLTEAKNAQDAEIDRIGLELKPVISEFEEFLKNETGELDPIFEKDSSGRFVFTNKGAELSSKVDYLSNTLDRLNGVTDQARRIESEINSIKKATQLDLEREYGLGSEYSYQIKEDGSVAFIDDQTMINYPAFAASAILIAVPITILYIAFQRFLIEGITAGANKG